MEVDSQVFATCFATRCNTSDFSSECSNAAVLEKMCCAGFLLFSYKSEDVLKILCVCHVLALTLLFLGTIVAVLQFFVRARTYTRMVDQLVFFKHLTLTARILGRSVVLFLKFCKSPMKLIER